MKKSPTTVLIFNNGPTFIARIHVINGPRSYAVEADGPTQADALRSLWDALADAMDRVSLARGGVMPLVIDTCTICGKPAHASETDDDGVGECCAAWVVEWHGDGGSARSANVEDAITIIHQRYPRADGTVRLDGAVEWRVPGGAVIATVRRAVRS